MLNDRIELNYPPFSWIAKIEISGPILNSVEKIKPLLDSGHVHFGENKIQEAENKWFEIANFNKNFQLHMVGKLQSNKAKKAVKLFNFIHSLDNEKLALKLSQSEKELNKKTKLFVQVNLGEEMQKSGIILKDLNTEKSTLEEIFINLVKESNNELVRT